MTQNATVCSRVIGLDCHPDSFTAALVRGQTPAQAIVESIVNKVPIQRLSLWAKKNLNAEDLVVLEASGNSFEIKRRLESIGLKADVLESTHLGKLKDAHANNDKISAVRIAKAYLAGTAKVVWMPDRQTQERRDTFHAHRKVIKRTTQMTNRLLSYLSDNGVRLFKGLPPVDQCPDTLGKAKSWTPRQWQIIEGLLLELRHAEEQREHWRSLMAQEVLNDPILLSMVRLCGVRDQIAFALGAIIGDIHRFANPRKLVAYVGLNPAFDDSGESEWKGGIGGHGRRDLRSLLIESGQAILRTDHPLGKWGRKLLATKGSYKLAVAAISRRLTVAIWYLMMGRWTPFEELDTRLSQKLGKIITNVGEDRLKKLGKTRKDLREQCVEALKTGRVYVLDRNIVFTSKTPPQKPPQEDEQRHSKNPSPPDKTPEAILVDLKYAKRVKPQKT
jgi:transposase